MPIPEEHLLYTLRQVPSQAVVVRESLLGELHSILWVLILFEGVCSALLQSIRQAPVELVGSVSAGRWGADLGQFDYVAAILDELVELIESELYGLIWINVGLAFFWASLDMC